MSLGGRDDIYPAVSAYRTPTPASGARNRYAEIMSQYGQAQPFSFFGYPEGYTGGFTPYQRIFNPNAAAEAAAAAAAAQNIPTVPGSGNSRGGVDREGPSKFSQMTPAERAAYYAANPTEGKFALGLQDLLGNVSLLGLISKNANPDAFYDSRLEKMGINPVISLDTQNLLAGEAMQRALDSQTKSQVVTAPIVETPVEAAAPAITEGLLSTPQEVAANKAEIQSLLSRYPAPVAPPAPTETAPIAAPAPAAETAQQKQDRENFESAQAWQRERNAYLLTLAPTVEEGEAIARANAESAAAWQREQDRANYESAVARQKAQTESDLETQRLLNRYPAPTGGGESQRGGESVGGYSGVNTSRATSGQFGMDPSTRGQYAQGGYVSMQHLNGPDPMGPDDGYAALKDGEFVINDKAVKKYGIELMNAINSGKIKKGKLLGLLEM